MIAPGKNQPRTCVLFQFNYIENHSKYQSIQPGISQYKINTLVIALYHKIYNVKQASFRKLSFKRIV